MIDPVTPSILMSVQSGIEVFAVIAFALSGLAAGLRVGMDFVGICFVAGVSAFGGGTLRDVLLDRRPFFWVERSPSVVSDYLMPLGFHFCEAIACGINRKMDSGPGCNRSRTVCGAWYSNCVNRRRFDYRGGFDGCDLEYIGRSLERHPM